MQTDSSRHSLEARIGYLDENRRFIQNALEMALSLGDFQEVINNHHSPERIFREAEKRIDGLIQLDARALYFVDPGSSDIDLSVCTPDNLRSCIENEMAFMIEEGFIAWAIRERRGVFILSKDRTQNILLHVIATHSRIKGLFVGLFNSCETTTPDVSLDLLSIILRNTANALDSVEYHYMLKNQNTTLQCKVDQKAKELVLAEKRLRRAQKMEAIGTLAGGVAHDLNNILTGIVSYPDLILMQIPDDSPLRKPVATIKNTGKKAAAIVQDLLTMARRGVAVTEVLNLNDIIAEYLRSPEFEKLQLYHSGVEVALHPAEDLLNILGSPIHLSKTVMNLVSNAAEAMPQGGKLTITTENRYVDASFNGYDKISEGDYVRLMVTDTGIGISPEDRERIFEPFYTKKVMGRSGTGLGMAVVWGTVKDHNGYIDLKSTEGKGTAFQIYFPATRDETANTQAGLSYEDYSGEGESILVVDDAKEQREIAKLILTELGYTVSTVSGGEDAVVFMRGTAVDLVILDMIMDPGMDGLDTYREILKLHPDQRAIIASGFSETNRVRQAQKLGAGQYVKKPYTIEKLGTAVKNELIK